MDLLQSLLRWTHIVAGILWIGLLYFFNWVNSAFAPTMDADTKRKVMPELLPRTLYWFRWGAAFTWITGVLLLAIVFYHQAIVWDDQSSPSWGAAGIMLAVVFLGVFLYDILYKTVLKNPTAGFIGGLVLSTIVVLLLKDFAGFSFRGYTIHLGAMFGTFMAFNVWFRIWPAQQKIITAIKNGEAPDAALVALAGTRSKHNTYMSVPLVFLMINQHDTWAAGNVYFLTGVILVGWLVTRMLYAKSASVKGF